MVRSETAVIDLADSLGQHDDAIAYAYAELTVDQGSKGVLGIGSDDAVKVWLNGKLIHENSMQPVISPQAKPAAPPVEKPRAVPGAGPVKQT